MSTPPPHLKATKLEQRYYACALLGAAFIAVGGLFYRTDQVRCHNWPPIRIGFLYAPIYLIALALLAVAWYGLSNLCIGRPLRAVPHAPVLPPEHLPTPTRIFLVGCLVNLIAMVAPPFLADDALAYAAIGRAMFTYHKNMYTPLGQALPELDLFRQMINHQESWLSVGSAYSPGWNWLAYGVAYLARDDLGLHLRLFQLISLAAALLTTIVAGQAAQEWALNQQVSSHSLLPGVAPQTLARQVAARAMALVLFCPLTLIEATNNAHNDSLLAFSVALFALFVVRRRPFWAFCALLIGPFIKASGLLLLGLYAIHLLLSRWQLRLPQQALDFARWENRWLKFLAGCVAAGLTAITVWRLLPWLEHYSSTTAHLLGSPADKYPYCTRSIECLPRALLHLVLGMPTASWVIGLGFRAAAGAFLLYMAVRSERGTRHLTWAASFLFFYYLYLHGHSHSWYLLSLLPLLSFADARLRPAMLVMLATNLSHYVFDFAFNCDHSAFLVGLTELLEGILVVVPPTVCLAIGLGTHSARRHRARTRP